MGGPGDAGAKTHPGKIYQGKAICRTTLGCCIDNTTFFEFMGLQATALRAQGERYGLMNAITSVARDTDDRELRWNLEKLGGDVIFARVPIPSRRRALQGTAA